MEAPEPILWRPLGELLVGKGLISEHELGQALEEHSSTGKRLGEVLVARGFVSAADLTTSLLEQVGGMPKEAGFGSGLAAAIQRRHAERPLQEEREALSDALQQPAVQAEGGGSTVANLVALDASYDRLQVDGGRAEGPACLEPEAELAPITEPSAAEAGFSEYEMAADRRAGEAWIETSAGGVVFFVPSPSGYSLLVQDDPAPHIGSEVRLNGKRYLVSKLGRSPLPSDRRPCAYLQELPSGSLVAPSQQQV